MYYILNETDQIIAADNNLLTLCNVTDVSGLSSKVARGDTTFTLQDDENVRITTNDTEETFPVSTTSLSSILGHMTLIELVEAQETEDEKFEPLDLDEEIKFDISADESDDLLEINEAVKKESALDLDEEIKFDISTDESDDLLEINEAVKKESALDLDEEIKFDISTDESDDLLEINEAVKKESALDLDEEMKFDISTDESDDLFEINEAIEEASVPEQIENISEPDETFDLLSEPTEHISQDTVTEEDESEIVVDVTKTSGIMGISDEDYTMFLSEYIDTALALEQDLQSDDTDTRKSAIMTLTDLSEIMHLPDISNIMESINSSTPEQQKGYIGYLYTTLSRLTTQSNSDEAVEMELLDSVETPTEIKVAKVAKKSNPNSFGTIDLSDVKSKHFDFQLEEAANDLSLPVELIEEFVHDFIEQGHIETKKMLEAYEEGDLAKIQSIGHLLKGASSNLRINALSDTLYKIQFCENENELDDLIKDYWAHFLSFEHQIDVISN